MICEHCGKEHDGNYGSGRFCSSTCARSFASLLKREEVNAKVSKALKGRRPEANKLHGFKKGYDSRRIVFTPEQRAKSSETKKQKSLERLTIENWDKLSLVSKKRLVLIQQDNKCIGCGLTEWLGSPITLELDHIDGDRANNARENFRCLCPNCHSQTETYRNKNSKIRHNVLDEDLIDALKKTSNIRQALIRVGLSIQHGNYDRAKRLIANMPE